MARRPANFVGGLVQEGAGIIYDWVARYGIDCDLKRGNIYAAYTPAHMQALEAKQALWRSHGMDDHELLDRQAIRKHIGSDVYEGGMIDHSGGHMHPLNLALGEAMALEGLGGVIYEQSPGHQRRQGRRRGFHRRWQGDRQGRAGLRQRLSGQCGARTHRPRHAGIDPDDGDGAPGRGTRARRCCQSACASRTCATSSTISGSAPTTG